MFQLLSHSVQMVEKDGLQLLRRMYELCNNDVKTVRQIARILAHLTQYGALHCDIAESGRHNDGLIIFLCIRCISYFPYCTTVYQS